MKNNPDYNLLTLRYLDGTATPDEVRLLFAWLKLSDQHKMDFIEIRRMWRMDESGMNDPETEQALSYLHNRILFAEKNKQLPKRKILSSFLKYAAVILFWIVTGIAVHQWSVRDQEIVVMNRILTGDDNKGRFILPDSTIVWLNKGSSLQYPEKFSKERWVLLDGEAYFEVKQSKSPFLVRAGEVDVKVTGTRFVVQNYEKRSVFQVVLVSGKVFVNTSSGKADTELFPGELYSYSYQTGKSTRQLVNPGNYMSWMERRLIFDNRPLSEILINMEGWYGIDISTTGHWADKTYMTFTIRDESIEEILKAMKLIAPIRYTWEGDKLRLSQEN
ncbi:MAG: DUF4974 domain-containing protein [Tannerellaceae bacterium]|nr:DUF4974 domain-containing protein [Tannerellaceae bacterium]